MVLVSSGVALRTDCLLTPLCKKCRQTPILIIPLSPHFLFIPQHALRSRAEGVRLASDGSGASLGARRLFRPLCKKCRQTPIFIIPLSPH